jgi:Nidogen-like/Carboxypeptidase regulatory-like domain
MLCRQKQRLRILFATVLLAAMVTSATSPRAAQAEGPNAIVNCNLNPANNLGHIDDSPSAGPINLGFTMNFFGTNRSQVFVNNNGNVTFGQANTQWEPLDLTHTTIPIIAPFFADVDTTDPSSGVTTYGTTTFNGHNAFCVNWVHVFGFGKGTTLYDSFQLLIIDQGSGNFDLWFNYDKITWDTTTALGTTTIAGVGFSAGTGQLNTFFVFPGSGQSGTFLDSNATTGLVNNSRNTTQKGRYIFHNAQPGGTISGTVLNSSNQPLSGAQVAICVNQTGGACPFTGPTNAQGNYSAIGLPAAQYVVKVFPPAGSTNQRVVTSGAINLASGQTATQNITLPTLVPPPTGVTVTQNGVTSPPGTIPHVTWFTPPGGFTLKLTAPAGSPGCGYTYHLFNESGVEVRSGLMAESPSGTYTSFVELHPGGPHGYHHVTFTAAAGAPSPPCSSVDGGDIYIDPSGVVQTTGGSPIAGATVTLFASDTGDANTFVQVPNGSAIMSPGNRNNPDTTDSTGHFGWDVVPGFYFVRASKTGCTTVNSAVLHIVNDPVTNLVLTLSCTGSSLLGDINGDGIVDIRDYGIWRQNFGQTNSGNPADLDLNNIVDIRDYGVWRANFGHTAPASR